MNFNRKKIISIIGLLLSGAVIGGIAGANLSGYVLGRMISSNTVIEQSAEMKKNVSVLKKIRNGELDKAAEIIETALDGNLIFFSIDHKVNEIIDQTAVKALKAAKQYRTEYPRTTTKEMNETLSKALSKTTIRKK